MPEDQLVLFEDSAVANLSPLTDLIPAQELIVGGGKQFKRAESFLRVQSKWIVRQFVSSRVPRHRQPEIGEPALLINTRFSKLSDLEQVRGLDYGEALVTDGVPLALRVRRLEEPVVSAVIEGKVPQGMKVRPADAGLLSKPWDVAPSSIIASLRDDLLSIWGSEDSGEVPNSQRTGRFPLIALGEVEVIGPIFIDTKEGPVVLEDGVILEPYAYLKGPLYLGPENVVVSGARVAGSYVGVQGRIGGEITTSIISDYSNKYHLGFLGHSYVGRWVNLGAGTITSNLKNTYGEIKVKGENTGLNKVGAFIGDHSKLSIGVLTYSGVVIGTASHVHGVAWEDVPPFTIYARSLGWGVYELEIDSVIRTYRRMAPRRGVDPDPVEEKLLMSLYEATRWIREMADVKRGRMKIK